MSFCPKDGMVGTFQVSDAHLSWQHCYALREVWVTVLKWESFEGRDDSQKIS